MSDQPVVVVGGGLTGSGIAMLLAKRGHRVIVCERRPDFREDVAPADGVSSHLGRATDTTKRSINLALSTRGQAALKEMGVLDLVMKDAIPMYGRAIHPPVAGGKVQTQAYGKATQAINSISRSLINCTLLSEAEKLSGVELLFSAKVVSVSGDGVVEVVHNGAKRTIEAKLVVGADGAFSYVREAMKRVVRMNHSQFFIEHGYKELEIPPSADGEFQLQPVNALHIWPRHEFMMIALPNTDKSFTCTLFAPFKKFDELDAAGAGAVEAFVQEEFPDAVELLPRVAEQYAENPTGALVTQRCNPWNVGDKIVLMGDAAHAVVPFYGQGMNAGLEDALVFAEILDDANGDFSVAVPKFDEVRRPCGDGVANLSFANYMEMRSSVASPLFRLQKRVEALLHSLMPSMWIPLYTMVSFTRIPYHEAEVKAARQERIIKTVTLGLVAAAVGGALFAANKFRLSRL